MNDIIVNTQLCEALGLDPNRVQRIVLVAAAGQYPRLFVSMVPDPGTTDSEQWKNLNSTLKQFELHPKS